MLQYRDTKDEDLSYICKLPVNAKEVFFISSKLSFPLGITQFQEYTQNNIHKTTFSINDIPVGYADFYKYENDDKLYLGNILLSYQYRGAGYGRFIMNTMLEKLKQESQKTAYLCVSNENVKQILLYKDMGFTPYDVDKRIDYDKKLKCVIFMKKSL